MFDCMEESPNEEILQSFNPKDSSGIPPYTEDYVLTTPLKQSKVRQYNEWLKKQGYKPKYLISEKKSKLRSVIIPVPRDPQAHIDALWRGLSHVLLVHKCPPRLREYARKDINKFLSVCTTQSELIRHMKYILNFPIARYLGCPEPLSPSNRSLYYHKSFYRWFSKRLGKFSIKNTHLFSSWLQCKRSCLPTEAPEILESYAKHFITLTSERPMTPTTVSSFTEVPSFVELIQRIKSSVRDELNEVPSVVQDQVTSIHASCENTRAEQGQHGSLLAQAYSLDRDSRRFNPALRDALDRLPLEVLTTDRESRPHYDFGITEKEYSPFSEQEILQGADRKCYDEYDAEMAFNSFHSELDRMNYIPCGVISNRTKCNIMVESRLPTLREAWEANVKQPGEVYYETPVSINRPPAVCTGVLEPLKVRMISKGDPKLYYRCKKIQLVLHKALRQIPLFNLIGRPQSSTDLVDILPPDLVEMKDPLWCSADYAGATDGLKIDLSKAIFKMIFDDSIDETVCEDAYNALFEHEISYDPVQFTVPSKMEGEDDFIIPAQFCEYVDEIPGLPGTGKVVPTRGYQKNGQLMGSILSFIFLCLCNAAVQAKFMQDVRKRTTYLDLVNGCRINGDDLLTVIDGTEQFNEFTKLADMVGFEMTVGKSYYHHSYANINSQALHFNLSQHKKWQMEVLHQSRLAYKEAVKYVNVSKLVDESIKYYDNRVYPLLTREVILHEGTGEVIFDISKTPNSANMQCPVPVPFLNMGLFYGQHKVLNRVSIGCIPEDISKELPEGAQSHDTPYFDMHDFDVQPNGLKRLINHMYHKDNIDLSSRFRGERPWYTVANILLDGATKEYSHRLCKKVVQEITDNYENIGFYKTNKFDRNGRIVGVKYHYYKKNIFLPISLGGLGIKAPLGFKFRINSKQRQLAMKRIQLMKLNGCSITRSLPLPGEPNREISTTYHPLQKRIDGGIGLDILDLTELDPGISYRNRQFYNRPAIPFGGHAVVC